MIILNVIFVTVVGVCVFGLLWTGMKMRQLTLFSNHMSNAIDQFYADKRWPKEELDVSASYDNYHKALPWKRNFADMVVVVRGRY